MPNPPAKSCIDRFGIPGRSRRWPSGFALVVTLSLMILLTIVAVGLLSLSAISLRGTSQAQARSEAQANARLALMMAIGELQKQLGPDQRVSANGAILDTIAPTNGSVTNAAKNPHWTGVWDSWIAGPKTAAQLSTYPSQDSHHQTLGTQPEDSMRPAYDQKNKHFRSWLLSLDPAESTNPDTARALALTGSRMPAANATAVELVGTGSLGSGANTADFVSARLLKVMPSASGGTARGRYGWWIGDESQKARIMDDSFESTPPQNLAERIFRSQAPDSTGTSTVIGLEKLKNDNQLAALPSLLSLDLVDGATGKPAENFHSITPFSHQVLADVREGGLKRDLSTLLERPIPTTQSGIDAESGDEFMLYRFDNAGQERVPIQDLAAYYQLYDSSRDPLKQKGIRYSSDPQNTLLPSGFQVAAPDYGDRNDAEKFKREYTSLYRSPVPVKVQILLGMKAEPIPDADQKNPNGGNTHRLVLGLLPAVTLWNPNNVPIVMNLGDKDRDSQMMRFFNLPLMIKWRKSTGYTSGPVSLAYVSNFGEINTGRAGIGGKNQNIFDMYFSATEESKTIFRPGEVRIFSFNDIAANYASERFHFRANASGDQSFMPQHEALPGWNSGSRFLAGMHSAWSPNHKIDPDVSVRKGNPERCLLAFKAGDIISFDIITEKEANLPYPAQTDSPGSAIAFKMVQKSHSINKPGPPTKWNYHNYGFTTRTVNNAANDYKDTLDFNEKLIKKGYEQAITGDIDGSSLINMAGQALPADQWQAIFQFALMAGSETAQASNPTPFAGRKFASRPFLHSSPIAPPFIDMDDDMSLYNYGWNWWIEGVNSIFESYVGVNLNDTTQSFYGGGYTSANGTSHVVQQEIPVAPPISIAALSHAHLGGFSLATGEPTFTGTLAGTVTAVGHGGLFPHTLQATGNSYAHPNIPAGKAFTTTSRHFNVQAGPKTMTFADHSYLANKALWDEFFFSSISPQPAAAKIFEGGGRDAKKVASEFFRNENPVPLPNRRITAYKRTAPPPDPTDGLFTGGFADKIAAHLMVQGAFNVNSTSVEAWKTFLSSLKGKPVAYLDKGKSVTAGVKLDEATPNGTPVGFSTLPNGAPVSGSSPNPGDPDQWTNWRELTDTEIDELATAIVKQVKLRGPFLSLSEFINRRLDSNKEELSAKGALQAALDDPDVSINSGFRSSARIFSGDEVDRVSPVFKKALEGPVAYGSSAYVDQADILRHLSEQFSPRGDTFVIRTYGDSLDASGKVAARAWCEAVVQRVPEYIDSAEEPHLKQTDLNSSANKTYGRKFQIVTFRWLGSSEV